MGWWKDGKWHGNFIDLKPDWKKTQYEGWYENGYNRKGPRKAHNELKNFEIKDVVLDY